MIALCCTAFPGCDLKEPTKDPAGPAITALSITSGESVAVPGEISFEAVIRDKNSKLSTLEVSAMLGETSLASASYRTDGKEAFVSENLLIPFVANMPEGASITVSFTAINVNGASTEVEKTVSIVRPSLPDVLYLTIAGTAHEMFRSPENPDVYATSSTDGFESIVSAFVSTSAELSGAEFIWGASGIVNKGEICDFSGAAGISISFPSVIVDGYAFNSVSFEVTAMGAELNVSVNNTALLPLSGLLYAPVNFTKDAPVAVTGLEKLEEAYNRDFFNFDAGSLTFTRESGIYDVYYSPKYNYMWIARMNDTAPDCLWVIGHGFTCAPAWHTDYARTGWDTENVTGMGYAVKIAQDLYQCSMYLNNNHEWGTFEFEVYSDREWNKTNGFGGLSLSGFTNGVALSGAKDGMPGLTSDTGFQPGYYVITFNNATGEIHLDRKTPWEQAGASGVFVKGVELETAEDFYYANIDFVNGETVAISGITDLHTAYNRDFFSYTGGELRFEGPGGNWLVQYFPAYNYFWLSNSSRSYPDCIYILGSGKWAGPVYDESAGSPLWEDVAYSRSAPYFVVAPKIAENKYKATMSMSTSNYNWRVLLEFYSDLFWGSVGEIAPATVSGPAASRFYIDGAYLRGVDESDDPFQKGNYELVITTSDGGADLHFTKID